MAIAFGERVLVAVLLLVSGGLAYGAFAVGRLGAVVLCVFGVLGSLYILAGVGRDGRNPKSDLAFADRVEQREPERDGVHLDRDGRPVAGGDVFLFHACIAPRPLHCNNFNTHPDLTGDRS